MTKKKRIPKVTLPRRAYSNEEREMVAMRIPTELWSAVKKIAPDYGSNTTEVVINLLEQFVQAAKATRR